MQKKKQRKSAFFRLNYSFTNETSIKRQIAGIRPLDDEELRAVAGGSESDVGNGH